MRGQNLKALTPYTDGHNPAYNSNDGICNEAGNSLNAVESELVPTRVLSPTASEASYKPKQRSYWKTNLKKKVMAPDSPGAELSSAESAALKRTRLQKYRE